MLDRAKGDRGVSWRLVWVAFGLIAIPATAGILTIVLLTASSASGRGGRRVISPSLLGERASAVCASTDRSRVESSRAGATATLVPPGPTSVLLCRYGARGTRVVKRSMTDRATVSQLGWELNALPSAKGTYSCPAAVPGESITAVFRYASGAPSPVSVTLSGCQLVSNGHVKRLGLRKPIIAELAVLARR